MKRKEFFKTLFGVAAAAVVAPSVLAQEEPKFTEQDYDNAVQELGFDPAIEAPRECWYVDGRYLYNRDFEEIMRIWRETGMLLYKSSLV